MSKCLVYLEEKKLSNAGGPLGYNYNLKVGLESLGCKDIEYLNTISTKQNLTSKCKKIKNRFLYSFLKGVRDIFNYIFMFLPFKHHSKVDLGKYDFVHFHDTFDMFKVRKSLKKYKGKILLTSHSPILPSVEIGMGVEKWVRILFFYVFLFERRIDKFSFKRTDYIISPCEDAMNSYKKYWKKFDYYTKNKTLYLLTGCISSNINENENLIRENYHLSKDCFNITFLGRHNKVKGYDLLKDFAISLRNADDLKFIVGGNVGPLYPPKIDNWIEVGFTTDALSIMKYADAYVSCNSDTYFDLATIQSLSVGTPVITKRVGGNLFFEKNNVPGVYLFSDFEEFKNIILDLKKMSYDEKMKLKSKIIDSYNTLFNEVIFARNYLNLLFNL